MFIFDEYNHMKKIMFICTANSCRSQIAEGFAKKFGGKNLEIHSAGLMAAGVHKHARAVMQEIGIDISRQRSKTIDRNLFRQMDFIITLCSYADAHCPAAPPGAERMHWPVKDPVGTVGSVQKVMHEFRRARDEIKTKVLNFIENVEDNE